MGNVFAVDDEEVARGVLAVGAGIDGPAALDGAMAKLAVMSPSTWVTPAMEPVVWMVRL